MRAAPPAVDIELGSGHRERAVTTLLYGLAGAVLLGWAALHLEMNPPAPALLGGLLAGLLGWRVWTPVRGHLRWDGAAWGHVPPDGPAATLRRVRLQVDLGSWMLLRLEPGRPGARLVAAAWCGITRREAGAAWHGLRLALYQGPMDAPDLTPDDGATR